MEIIITIISVLISLSITKMGTIIEKDSKIIIIKFNLKTLYENLVTLFKIILFNIFAMLVQKEKKYPLYSL